MSVYASRCVENKNDGKIGFIERTRYNDPVEVSCDNKTFRYDSEEDMFNQWELKDYAINSRGQEIHIGSIWFVDISPSEYFPKDESWMFRVDNIGYYGLTLKYVNWKRKGIGSSTVFTIDDLNTNGNSDIRPATESEIKYFESRITNR